MNRFVKWLTHRFFRKEIYSYKDMAADELREREAQEWIEAHAADVAEE